MHIFFFGTYIGIETDPLHHLIDMNRLKKYFEEYKNVHDSELESESNKLFQNYNKTSSLDTEMKLIAIARAICSKEQRLYDHLKPKLTPRFDQAIDDWIEKMIIYEQVNSYTRADKTYLRPYLKQYTKMSLEEYRAAWQALHAKAKKTSATVMHEAVIYDDKTLYDQNNALIDAFKIVYIILEKFFGNNDPTDIELIFSNIHEYKGKSLTELDTELDRELNDIQNHQMTKEEEFKRKAKQSALFYLRDMAQKEIKKRKSGNVSEQKLTKINTFILNPLISKKIAINFLYNKNIKKFLATSDRLIFQLDNENSIISFDTDDLTKEPVMIVDNNARPYILSDIAVDYDNIMWAFVTKKGLKSGSYIQKNRDNRGYREKALFAHETPIKNLFVDSFVVSHSKGNNIRFFDFYAFRDQDEPKKKAEYKANRLIAYRRKCLITEEGISFFGIRLFNGLYIKYVDQNAKVIAEKKIASYNKGQCVSFLGDINHRGDAIIYDQCTQSLTAYTKDHNNKISCFKYQLPKELIDHAPIKQIHYLNKNNDLSINDRSAIIMLVYDDQIYAIIVENNQFTHKKIFSLDKTTTSETILTTTCAFTKYSPEETISKNIIWIVLEEKVNTNKQYSIQSIIIDKE
jgi:hypothetical protein